MYKSINLYLHHLWPDTPPLKEQQIFVYRDAPDGEGEIAIDLISRYKKLIPSIPASLAASLSPSRPLVSTGEYVCADPTDHYCIHWHDTDWCPNNKDKLSPPREYAQCAKYDADGTCLAVMTSLSDTPIEAKPGALIREIFLVTLSLAGGVSVLLLIAAGYKILTSSGKPEAIQAGKEQLTSAIVGLLFIIFSYVIFQFIIADLLKIPGITN
jgi:hypothetical protein